MPFTLTNKFLAPMIKPVLSIIIVSYNTCDITINCLKSVIADKGLQFNLDKISSSHLTPTQIIIVDNASKDNSLSAIKQFSKTKNIPIRLIVNQKNIGFAKANNQGIKIATGNFILFLNSDTLILHSAISQSLTWLSSHPEAIACTAQLLNKDKTIQATGGFFPNLLNTLAWSIYLDDLPLFNKIIPAIHPHTPGFYTRDSFYKQDHRQDWLTGAFILIKDMAVKKTAGFDENYFMYAEDLEWCYRIKLAFPKKQIWYLIGPQVIHLGGASATDNQAKLLNEYMGILFFFKKHKSNISYKIAGLLLKINAYIRSLFNPAYKNLWQKI